MAQGGEEVKIIWLEDQKKFFSDIAKTLKSLGFCVQFVETGDEFEECLANQKFDYALIDIRGGEFNGVEVYRRCKEYLGDATPIFLSGWLRDRGIEAALKSLKDEVVVLDKVFSSSNASDLTKTFVPALLSAKARRGVESNKTYYKEAEASEFDVGYSEFLRLSSLKRANIRKEVLEKARPEIEEKRRRGAVWFLVAGPDGEIIESKESRPKQFDSKTLSHRCLELERPCFVYEIGGGIEEHAGGACRKHYEYYFTVDISFPGSDKIFKCHFDTGAEQTWFDELFLKNLGVGVGLDADHLAELGTMDGPEEFEYWRMRVKVGVFNQNNPEQYHFTEIWVNGLDGWERTFLGGRAPEGRLCEDCQEDGRCVRRIGLVGQDLVRDPLGFGLLLDGKTGATLPVFSNTSAKKKGR